VRSLFRMETSSFDKTALKLLYRKRLICIKLVKQTFHKGTRLLGFFSDQENCLEIFSSISLVVHFSMDETETRKVDKSSALNKILSDMNRAINEINESFSRISEKLEVFGEMQGRMLKSQIAVKKTISKMVQRFDQTDENIRRGHFNENSQSTFNRLDESSETKKKTPIFIPGTISSEKLRFLSNKCFQVDKIE
jgi:hypothetical protein